MDYIYSLSELMLSINHTRFLIVSMCALILSVCLYKTKKLTMTQSVMLVLIITYSYLVLSLTILDRPYSSRMVRLMPLWSYPEIFRGNYKLLLEVIINVFMLMPLGFFLPAFKRFKTNSAIALFGFLFSMTIECSQFIFMRGWFEFDDMIHNTLGIVIGYIIYKKIKKG